MTRMVTHWRGIGLLLIETMPDLANPAMAWTTLTDGTLATASALDLQGAEWNSSIEHAWAQGWEPLDDGDGALETVAVPEVGGEVLVIVPRDITEQSYSLDDPEVFAVTLRELVERLRSDL
ncbi:hypothetical protein ACFCZ3_14765 [Cellulosimicrobium cellulans]|uniref:hypothetical protein n=1 Tax=Cellulosimicrobium cellulans TaxID=1710 RepID=UPI0035E17DDF